MTILESFPVELSSIKRHRHMNITENTVMSSRLRGKKTNRHNRSKPACPVEYRKQVLGSFHRA